ncbi:MAG: 2-oxoacid:acceptor oxidoreductase family protein [Chloroflexi bacterium]|nr:2-oxoacid:acceptor oxidoreductase family protein [Chloroflexota bacterium]
MSTDHEFIIAGFGGQGVLFAGLVLAHAGMTAGRNVAWIPSYGPEMRGGTANCTVIISEEEIGSPIVNRPSGAIVMNEPSLAKYAPMVKPGGVIVVNSSLVKSRADRTDIRVLEIPANEVAFELGNDRVANMVALGALLAATEALPMDVVEAALPETLGPSKERFIAPNREALRRGAALVATHPAATG